MSLDINEVLPNEAVLEVLYDRCVLISKTTIKAIGFVPEYVQGLSAHKESMSDEVVYEVLRSVYPKMSNLTPQARTRARHTLNKVSMAVTGSSDSWKIEVDKSPKLPYNKALACLYFKCPAISDKAISVMQFIPEFQDALLSYRGTYNEVSVLEVLRHEYYKIEDGQRKRFARRILNSISKTVNGNPQGWRVKELERSDNVD